MPSLGLGLGTQFVRPLLDSDVAAFKTESGATDVAVLNRLVRYLKAQSLYDNFVIYPMKAAQNAGSGATVYGLGGLTTNDMTLVNSPTWGASGIAYNGTTQYGSIADFLGTETTTFFSRFMFTSATSATNDAIFAQYDFGNNNRSIMIQSQGTVENDPIRLFRSANGILFEGYDGPGSLRDTSDSTYVSEWVDGGDRFLWKNKTSAPLTLSSSPQVTSKFNTAVNVTWAAALNSGSPSNFCAMTGVAGAVCATSLTTGQRETITDLINAL